MNVVASALNILNINSTKIPKYPAIDSMAICQVGFKISMVGNNHLSNEHAIDWSLHFI